MNTAIKKDRPTAADIVAELTHAAMPIFRRGTTLYTRAACGYRKLSPQRFLSWYETLTGKDAAHLSQAWALQILTSTAVQDYATELPTKPLLTRISPTTEQISGFTLHIEHVPASLSHRELHHPMPIFDIIGAVRDSKQTCINEEGKRLVTVIHKHLTELSADHLAQHRFLILAQSRELALSILHSNAFCTQLQAHFKPITDTAHQPKDDDQPCHASVFLCYPTQEEPLCPHMMQQDQHQTNRPDIMAHIFTPEEVTHLIQHFPSIHAPHSTTEPADTQEETSPGGSYAAIPVRTEDIKDLIPDVIKMVRYTLDTLEADKKARTEHTFPAWVQALALAFFLLFTGGCIGAALALHLAGIIIK